ncbi:MAG: hypothetical protein AB9883_04865 [Acidaminococcaceae bacterium]
MSKSLLSKEEETLLTCIDEEKQKITSMYKKLLSDYMTKGENIEIESGSKEYDR